MAASSARTTLHLIRHASYGALGQVLAGRTEGHGLDARGHAQARRIAEALAPHKLHAILSSPLQRARETAEPIARLHNLSTEIAPGLNEIDFGTWTGQPFASLDQQPEWQAFNAFRAGAEVPGGEIMLVAQARAVATVLRLRQRFPAGELALVSHGDVIKALLAHFLGVSLDLFRRIEVSPASRSILVLETSGARIDAINLPPGA